MTDMPEQKKEETKQEEIRKADAVPYGGDYIIRGTAAGDQIRVYAATTRDMVEAARAAHNTSPVATAALGRLLTAGAMMGSMMEGEDSVLTLKIEGDGPLGGIVVTAEPNADVKGYVYNPEVLIHANSRGKLDVAGAVGHGTLQVIMDIGLKDPYVGQVDLVSGEIAEDLTYYYAASEQTPSSVALGVLMNKNNTVRQAGGFILQLMPDTDEAVIEQLEATLSGISSVTELLNNGRSPEDILEEILGGMGLTILERMPTRFHCNCTRERVERVLATLGEKDLRELAESGEDIELKCSFCYTSYLFSPEEVREILRRSGRA